MSVERVRARDVGAIRRPHWVRMVGLASTVLASTVLETPGRQTRPVLLPERRCRTPLACDTGWSFRCPTGVRPGACRRLIYVEFRGWPVFPTGPGVEPAPVENREGSRRTGGLGRCVDAAGESSAVV